MGTNYHCYLHAGRSNVGPEVELFGAAEPPVHLLAPRDQLFSIGKCG